MIASGYLPEPLAPAVSWSEDKLNLERFTLVLGYHVESNLPLVQWERVGDQRPHVDQAAGNQLQRAGEINRLISADPKEAERICHDGVR